MKKLNKKGFTLIELLAVIVILALLVAVAIPAVTKYLNTSRAGVFKDAAHTAISAVRNDEISTGQTTTTTYDTAKVNELLQRKLTKSPYGGTYEVEVQVTYTNPTSAPTYTITLSDGTYCLGTKGSKIAEDKINETEIQLCNPTTPA